MIMNVVGLSQTDVAVYGLLSSLLPALIAVINRPHFPAWLKQIIMFVVAVIAGGVTYGLKNGWDFSSRAGIITALIGVWLATQAAYLVFWKQALAPAIESSINSGAKAPKHAAEPQAPAAAENAPAASTEPAPDSYDEQPDNENYDPDYALTHEGYADPIPEGKQTGPADEETAHA